MKLKHPGELEDIDPYWIETFFIRAAVKNDPQVKRAADRASKREQERKEGKRPGKGSKPRWSGTHLRPVQDETSQQ